MLPIRPETLKKHILTAVPYRREPGGNRTQYSDFTIDQILFERRHSVLRERPDTLFLNEVTRTVQPRVFEEDYLSEGWALSDGTQGFLMSKYSQSTREYLTLDRVLLPDDLVGLRWGGAGGHDNAEGCCRIEPGASLDLGVTRVTSFRGNYVQGYYAFRAEMESRGHSIPPAYDPPSHWNELYDNKLWWLDVKEYWKPENRKKFYMLADMKEAAAKAQEMGCEALYLDPGWETTQSSHLWAEDRLGSVRDFVAMLQNEYGGLKLSLHTPLAGWTGTLCGWGPENNHPAPGTALLPKPDGVASLLACGASEQYINETVKRLKVLADAGVCFFMFDGTVWMGECWSKDHGHSYPSRASEHVEGMNRVAREVHKNNPEVLVEMHDQMFGGVIQRYVPSYYGNGVNASGEKGWDELWAFELMWNPMHDLVGGHSISLYYYNLAYSIPAYIHIDLRADNAQCLMLWWSISTCRHLGVGGTHPDEAVRRNQRTTISTYRRLKAFFTTGTFYGIDELTHVHVDRAKTGAVINCFNLEEEPAEREINFAPGLYGFDADAKFTFEGGAFAAAVNGYVGKITIPAYGHYLIEVIQI